MLGEEKQSLVRRVLERLSPRLTGRRQKITLKKELNPIECIRPAEHDNIAMVEGSGDGITCSIADSPFRILSLAAKGSLEGFQRLYEVDKTRIDIKDSSGCTPAHKAANNGHENILKFIIDRAGDINAQNHVGDTPLHFAVKSGQLESVKVLLENGAKCGILNSNHLAPIHLAVECDATESLKALLAHTKVDPNLRGENGQTPLHYCAIKDMDECAKILLEHHAEPCIKCDNSFFPINLAGKCASAKTLEILIKHVETLGYTREQIFSFSDKENNMPLHGAVNSGDLKAVRVCLIAGAPIDAKQEDKSTPLHFACAQGSLDMVKMMHDTQTDRFKDAMHAVDILKMTPLHRAALFDHVHVVQYLIEHGSDINVKEMNENTPLFLALSKGGWRTTAFLLQNGADVGLKDKKNRNFLHLAIKYGISIKTLGCSDFKDLKHLLNERDDFGCTPLHYASKAGRLIAIDDLIKHGATINPKDIDKKSPLHFAAKYGRYNTCKRLLESRMGPNIINETDGDGLAALHIAAQNGHTKIISLLMQKGAYVSKDNQDNSPLHLAAANGYTKSIKLLLTVYPNLLDITNKEKNTALHLASRECRASAVDLLMSTGATFTRNRVHDTFFDIAIRERNAEVAYTIIRHDRWEEAMDLGSHEYGTAMNGLVQYLPDVCMVALDRCKTTSKLDSRSPDFYVHCNFKYLQCPQRLIKAKRRVGIKYMPMVALNTMVLHRRVQCLSHPLSEAYLNMKWRAYGAWFHVSHFVVYAIYLAMMTLLVCTCTYSYKDMRVPVDSNNSAANASLPSGDMPQHVCKFTSLHFVCACSVMIFALLSILKEFIQIISQRERYFKELTNALEWILYIFTLLFMAPFVTRQMCDWQWEAGAIAVFLAWFNCLLFLQRFDFFGIYVVMFLEILRTLLQVLCVFSILLVAFGMAFFILMNKEESRAYSSPGLSLLRTAMMMLELDYMSSFNQPFTDDDSNTLYFGGTTILLLAVFVLFMPILLMNLLIGLAVGDIESVQKNATLKRLTMQVELHTNLEKKLPFKILDMVDKLEYTYYPNRCASHFQQLWTKLSFPGEINDPCKDSQIGHQNQLYGELYKQKQRLKEITESMSKQYELLRLVVQKMEIRTEDENRDEGHSSECVDIAKMTSKWTIAHELRKQGAVIAHWKRSVRKK